MISRPLTKIWRGLVNPASGRDTREHHLSRTLNIILLLLLAWGVGFEIQYRMNNKTFNTTDVVILTIVGILALAYSLNRQGQFRAATLLTLGLFITSTFAFSFFQHLRGSNNFSVLYYL